MSAQDLRGELDGLLGEDPGDARARERATFAEAAGSRADSIVLFGAGGLGRRTLAGLRAAGLEPLAFADNRESLWGSEVDGLVVLSPAAAAEHFGGRATFVVTIWGAGSTHRFAHSVAQLATLGADVVVPVSWLYWAYAEQLLPFYALELPSRLLEQSDAVRLGYELLDDDESRAEYVEQVRWRLTGDPGGLSHPVAGAQYLVHDVARPDAGDVVLDCGAYDGDTLRAWLEDRGANFDRYVALEPDPDTCGRLAASVASLPPEIAEKVEVLAYSIAGYTGTTTFSATGTLSSAIGQGEGITVECITLDDLERRLSVVPTFLKVDIEGAELDALSGGEHLIASARPMIAIAIYHCQDHLWRVPLAVRALWDGYRFFIRPHNEEGWDLICYAVPPERVPAP